MKFGFRITNFKKSIKARTTGRAERIIKSSINPLYGKKGVGYIKNPKKAIYDKVYNNTTVRLNNTTHQTLSNKNNVNNTIYKEKDRIERKIYFNNKLYSKEELKRLGRMTLIASIVLILLGFCIMPIGIIILILGIIYFNLACKELKESKK